MKVSRAEFGHEYATYRFGYCEWAELERGDAVEHFYANGFLPYSADPKIQGKFYMARSARIPLARFATTSENRRIAKRFDNTLVRRVSEKCDVRVRELFLEYFAKRHGKSVMSAERFDAILSTPLPLRVITYEQNNEPVAAVLEVAEGGFGHFWFSAYDPALVEQSLGMWLMLDCVRAAKEAGLAHYYLGTVYGGKALYKTNLEPLEWWDGSSWMSDLPRLKALARAESRV